MIFFQKLFNNSPLLYGIFPLLAGIILADKVGHSAILLLVSGVAFLICLVLSFVLYRQTKRLGSSAVVCLCLLFFWLGVGSYALHHDESKVVWPVSKKMWQGIIVDAADKGKTIRCSVQLLSESNGENGRICHQLVNAIFLKDSSKVVSMHAGAGVLFYGRIVTPHNEGNPFEFDEAEWLMHHGITGDIFVARDWKKLSENSTRELFRELSLYNRIRLESLRLRERLTERYEAFPLQDKDRGVLAALTLGDKYQLSHEVRDVYSHVGVSHVLALSGLHLGILMFFLLLLLKPFCRFRYGRIVSKVISLTLIWSFVFLTGMGISLLRAAVMYSLFCLLMLRRQGGNGLNNLSVAAFVLLCVSPDALFDIGFQLSFLSVFSILAFSPFYGQIRPQKWGWGFLTDFIFVAVAAQVATAPLVAYYFNGFPIYFLFGNFVVIPCAYLLLGGTLLFFLFWFCGPLETLLMHMLSMTVEMMNKSLSFIASLPHAVVTFYPTPTEVGLCYLILIFLIIYVSRRRLRDLTCLGILCVAEICVNVYEERADRVPAEIVFYNCRRNPCVHFFEDASHSWLWSRYPQNALSDLRTVSQRFWSREQISLPQVFNGNVSFHQLKSYDNVIHFYKYTLVMLQDGRWRHRISKSVLGVDYCYICRGFRGHLSQLARVFHPRQVILDASLSEKQRRDLMIECRQLKWSGYDMDTSGAFIKKCL